MCVCVGVVCAWVLCVFGVCLHLCVYVVCAWVLCVCVVCVFLSTHLPLTTSPSACVSFLLPPFLTTPSFTGYMIGLIATFIALEVMKSGQPALLFLVPSTLIPTLITAAAHWELKQLWIGSGSDKTESKSVTFKELKEREDMEEETELEEFEEHKTFKRGQVDSDSDVEVYSRDIEAAVKNDDTVDEDSDSEDKQLIPSTTTGP